MCEKKAKMAQASEINGQISQLDCMIDSIYEEKLKLQKTRQNLELIEMDLRFQLQYHGFDINKQIMIDFCSDMIGKYHMQISELDCNKEQFKIMRESLLHDWQNLIFDDENKKQEETA